MRRTAVALLMAALLALVVAGCGEKPKSDGVASLDNSSGDKSDGSDGSDGDDKDSDLSPEDAAMEFSKCMRENGVDMPDPVIDEDGGMSMRIEANTGDMPDRETQEKAMKACEKFMGDVRGNFSEEDRSKMEDEFLEFAKCMRENGVDMPDPDFSGEGGGAFALELDPNSDTFKKAEEACRELAPGGGMSRAERVG